MGNRYFARLSEAIENYNKEGFMLQEREHGLFPKYYTYFVRKYIKNKTWYFYIKSR